MSSWMRKGLRAGVALLLLAALAAAAALARAEWKMRRHISLPERSLALLSDAASLARGRYLYQSRGCVDCHGSNGAGRVFIDDRRMGLYVAGPNISPGPGSVVASYRGADWDRLLRHGVKPDGRAALIMPSEDFARFTDGDIEALAAYLRQLPPTAGGPAVLRLPLPVRLMYGLDLMRDAAQKIDHSLPPAQPVPEAVTVAHGAYVAQACQGCHGARMSGGRIPGAPPDWPAAANLTPGEGSAMPRYPDAAAFKAMLRSGHRPDGSAVSPVMPFAAYAQMSDVDTEATYLYLRSLPARDTGGR